MAMTVKELRKHLNALIKDGKGERNVTLWTDPNKPPADVEGLWIPEEEDGDVQLESVRFSRVAPKDMPTSHEPK